MRIAFRADSSLQIGTGHIMRCLTLADELSNQGAEIYFVCREHPGNLASFITSKGYNVFLMPYVEANASASVKHENDSSYIEWLGVSVESDALETHSILDTIGHIDWLVVDHYALDEQWENVQRPIVDKILVIDDLADRKHNCDVLLDQNYYEDMNYRYQGLLNGNCNLLLGPKYSMLRKEFREARGQIRKREGSVKKLFIFFGGVDATDMTSRVINSVVELKIAKEISVDVVIGSTNPHRQSIETICNSYDNIKLYIQANNMAQLMSEADLCVGSGGTVTWERCCLGLPTLAFPVAENQKKLLHDSARAGLVYVPDVDVPGKDELACHIGALLKNASLREHISVAGLNAIDGRGVLRLVNNMLTQKIALRLINADDVRKIFDWRNDMSVRKYSHNSDVIDYEQHQLWFEKVLNNAARPVLIGSMGGEELGVVRFDISDDKAEISIYLASNAQGKGHGSSLLKAGEHWLVQHNPQVTKILAEVLPENIASKKLFELCGYRLNAVHYQKSISQCQ